MRRPAGRPDGSPGVPFSPYEPEAGAQGVFVGAAVHLAVVGEEERGTLVEGGNGGQAEIERRAAADLEAGGEVCTEGGADRCVDPRCYGEVLDAAAALGEGELIGRGELELSEPCDRGPRRDGEIKPVPGLDLAEDLVGTGVAVGDAGRQAGGGRRYAACGCWRWRM